MLEELHVADRALADQFVHAQRHRRKTEGETELGHLPGPFGGRDHLGPFGQVAGQRLLAEHVQASLKGSEGKVAVRVVGRRDDDGVDEVPLAEQAGGVRLDPRDAIPFGGGLGDVRARVNDGPHLKLRHRGERREVRACSPQPKPDHRDADGLFGHVPTPVPCRRIACVA